MVKAKLALFIEKFTPVKVKQIFENRAIQKHIYKLEFAQLSFSQEGEDLVLNRIFSKKDNGVYIDVGAHHPRRFSNTYIFYKRGWRGINIDPVPGMKQLFDKERPEDKNIEIGIGEKKGELVYHMFNEPALNTFSEEEANKKSKINGNKIIAKKVIKTDTLESILDSYLHPHTTIDFLSIDAEGLDEVVIKSNNFEKYKPLIILVEALELKSIENIFHSELYKLLKANNYNLFAKTFNTLFFKLNA